jgi:hypothetical protein
MIDLSNFVIGMTVETKDGHRGILTAFEGGIWLKISGNPFTHYYGHCSIVSKANLTAIDHLEALLVVALDKGLYLRRANLKFTEEIKNSHKDFIFFHMGCLDSCKCSWSIQNKALDFYNNADIQKTYELLHKKSLRSIAQELLDSDNSCAKVEG